MNSKRTNNKIIKAYEKVRERNPGISNDELEELTKRYLFKRRMIKSGLLFLFGFACFLSFNALPDMNPNLKESLQLLLASAGVTGELGGILLFARGLHNPMTKYEAQQLKDVERIEKQSD